jgi:hypothetical protein
MYNLVKYLLTMRQVFEQLIVQLRNPASAETQHAMRMLNTPNPNDIPTLVNMRMNYQPPFFDSMGLFANFQETERAFAETITGLNAELWVNFVTQVRTFVRDTQPQQMQQQQMQQQQMQQQQMQQRQQMQQQQQWQQQQMQRQRPRQPRYDYDAEPVLGPVPPMPRSISPDTAARIANEIYDEAGPRLGGKRSRLRSKKRGRKSIHRRKKSMHKKRK